MGDFADMEMDRCMDMWDSGCLDASDNPGGRRRDDSMIGGRVEPSERVADGWWRDKSGNRIKISDMTDSHLQNTIKYLARCNTGYGHIENRRLMTAELKRRERR